MDLKGSTLKCAVGRRVTVLYDEGASELVPYAGVVTYAQQSRLYVVFDRFDEADGAWINDADDWSWRDDGSPPPPPPPPVWKPGDMPPPIDKIFLKRLVADDDDEELMNGDEPMMAPAEKLSFFVKWKALAHIHSQWVPRADLELDANNKQRVQRWLKIQVFLISFIFLLFLLFCRFFISFYSAARAAFSPTCRTPPLLHVTYFFFRVQAAALEAGVENTWELGDEADDGGEKEDEEAKLKKRRQQDAERKRRQRAMASEEAKRREREKDAQRKRDKRAQIISSSPEELKLRRERDAERMRKKRAQASPRGKEVAKDSDSDKRRKTTQEECEAGASSKASPPGELDGKE